MYMWDRYMVPVMLIVSCICVPWTLWLVEVDHLKTLKFGVGMQFLVSMGLCGCGGIAFGLADGDAGRVKFIRRIFDDSKAHMLGEDGVRGVQNVYTSEDMVLPYEALFYYDMRIEPQYSDYMAQVPGAISETNEIVDFDTWDATAQTNAWHLVFLCILGGVIHLAQFSVSMSYLCHVYYGPAGARREDV